MAESLSEQERQQIAEAILNGSRVSPKYAPSIIESTKEMELIWSGKSDISEQTVLPFQSIEQIDEPRVDTSVAQTLFDFDSDSGRQSGGWTNKLIWGDNRLILSSLTFGPMRHAIEEAGGLKLVYIDPPFDVGYDFSMDVAVGEESVSKEPSVLEQFAYRDTWGKGTESFASMIRERLLVIADLLAPDGKILIHCDYRTTALIRLVGDEIFGTENYRNEIVWSYRSGGAGRGTALPRKHDSIHFWAKGEQTTINSFSERQYLDKKFMDSKQDKQGRFYVDTILRDVLEGVVNIVDDDGEVKPTSVRPVLNLSAERTGYPTQKPEGLLEILVSVFSNPGDLVGDFFCGSGTTMAVAEKLGRKWIGADLGRFAVHTSRKRLISVQRELKEKGEAYRSFEILNLGGYERQLYLNDVAGEADVEGLKAHKRKAFVELVLSAYGAQSSAQLPPFSGSKHLTAVLVGEVNRAVTQSDVEECIEAAIVAGITKVDILGFEFEMGISPLLSDRAKEQGLALTLRYIPSDVFDTRAVKAGAVQFYEVGYLEVKPETNGLNLRINLSDFGVFYRQTDADEAAHTLRPGSSKVVVDQGQVLRLAKSKSGSITRENVTSKWEDWIDYWSIDFNFESRPEIIRVLQDQEETELATGRFIFENEWQSFRTVKDRNLELWSATHTYDAPGTYAVAVKVIDIFGNDTTRVFKVKVG
jgi:DNA modification methylase